jgi:lipopolysaccharide transport system permease protein
MIGETTNIPDSVQGSAPGNAPSKIPTGLSGLYRFRDLLWSWTTRNVRGRYQQSVLGWLWAIIQPVASVLIFTVIFTMFVPVDTEGVPYILFSYTAMVPWTLLALAITDMSNALVFNMNLVTKIYFPREILPLAAMLARLLDFGIAALLLAVLVIIYRPDMYIPGLPMLPVILIIQLALITGLGLAFAALNVFYRDVQPFLALGIQLWFYASPIIYPVTAVPTHLQPLYFLNPMAGILESYRNILLYNQPPSPWLWLSAVVSAIVLVVGYWFFKRVEFLFADLV